MSIDAIDQRQLLGVDLDDRERQGATCVTGKDDLKYIISPIGDRSIGEATTADRPILICFILPNDLYGMVAPLDISHTDRYRIRCAQNCIERIAIQSETHSNLYFLYTSFVS